MSKITVACDICGEMISSKNAYEDEDGRDLCAKHFFEYRMYSAIREMENLQKRFGAKSEEYLSEFSKIVDEICLWKGKMERMVIYGYDKDKR